MRRAPRAAIALAALGLAGCASLYVPVEPGTAEPPAS